ncbi:MAG: hypothetical protein ACTHLO_10575 [Pseudolabrys sp.]
MKALILSAALLIAAVPVAYAQNQPTTNNATAPGNINHAGRNVPGYKSGAESQQAARGTPARIVGRSHYCAQVSVNNLRCRYRTMASCKKAAGNSNLSCVANPRMAVGSAPRR